MLTRIPASKVRAPATIPLRYLTEPNIDRHPPTCPVGILSPTDLGGLSACWSTDGPGVASTPAADPAQGWGRDPSRAHVPSGVPDRCRRGTPRRNRPCLRCSRATSCRLDPQQSPASDAVMSKHSPSNRPTSPMWRSRTSGGHPPAEGGLCSTCRGAVEDRPGRVSIVNSSTWVSSRPPCRSASWAGRGTTGRGPGGSGPPDRWPPAG
jgi:hypothetical protein